MKKSIIIGTRKSKLALIQSRIVQAYLEEHGQRAGEELSVTLLPMTTTGDRILDRTLEQVGGKGLFVKELDRALLDGRSDLSVHSLKDMPMELPEGLPILACSQREDPRDVLVLPLGEPVDHNPDIQKPIGCSSRRRQLQLTELYPDHIFTSVRGNLQTRLQKLDAGEYGGLILAAAGLKRLGLTGRISRYFTTEECVPAAGQGILAVQGRSGELLPELEEYDDEETHLAAVAERAFVRKLEGGCLSPHTAYARIEEGCLHLTGLYYEEQSGVYRRGERVLANVMESDQKYTLASQAGETLAEELGEQ